MPELHTYEGGCHCGGVRFQVRVERYVALDCNCSICRKKGFLHLIVPSERFTLLRGGRHPVNVPVQHRYCSAYVLSHLRYPRLLHAAIPARRHRRQHPLLRW